MGCVEVRRQWGWRLWKAVRGIGVDDLDNDGDLDVVVLNVNAPPSVLRNDSKSDNRWLMIELQGVASNKDGGWCKK